MDEVKVGKIEQLTTKTGPALAASELTSLKTKGVDLKAALETPNETPKAVSPKPDATTMVACVWMMYKLNIITRYQVRDFLDTIKQGKWPDDMLAYLQSEVAKLG